MSENGMRISVGFSIMGMIKNYFFWSIIIGLLAMNIASVASASFNHSMFRLLSNLPFSEFLSNSPTMQQTKLVARNKQLIKSNATSSKKLQQARLLAKNISIENKKLKRNTQHALATQKQLSIKNKKLIKNNGMLVEKLQKAEMTSDVFRERNKRLNLTSQQRLSKISKARGIGRRVAIRTARNVSVNLSSLASEVVPVAGVAVIATVTAMDIADACATENDLDEILGLLGGSGIGQEKGKVCGMNMPNIAELKQGVGSLVSQAVTNTKSNAYHLNKAVDKVIYDAVKHFGLDK